MNIELGCVNGNKPEEVQPVLNKAFGDLAAIGPYKNLFVSGVHLKSWKDCKPDSSSKAKMEMYVFSSPNDSTSCQFYDKPTSYKFKGKQFTFSQGQADRISFTDSPLVDYDEMADDKGVPIAYRKDNKVWILTDLFHDIKNEGAITGFMTELIKFIEGREHYGIDFVDLIVGASGKIGKEQLDRLKSEASAQESSVASLQEQYGNSLKELVIRNKRLSEYKMLDKANLKIMAQRLLSHKFVSKILPYNEDGIIVVTKPITNGPFEYGEWKITIAPSVAVDKAITQLYFCGREHPYQYSDQQRVCLGGFLSEIIGDISMGKWDDALNYYILWVTNYSPSTQIHDLIPFLEKTMGTEEFNMVFNKLCAPEISPDTHNPIKISSIYGDEMTIIATNKKTKAIEKKVVKLW